MAIARRIAYNVLFNSTLKVVSTVFIALFSIRLITGYLGPAGFGEYATVLAFFAFFGALADLGLANITTREISRENADEKYILGNVASLRLLSNGILLFLGGLLIWFLHYGEHVKWGVVIVTAALIFAQFSAFLNSIFQKRLAMDRVALIEIIGKSLQLGLIFLIVKFDWGFVPIIAALFFNMAFNSTLTFLLSRKLIQFRLRFDKKFLRDFLRASLPLGATTVVTFFYFKMDTLLLSFLQPSAHVGIYNVAYKIMENLIFFPAMLTGLILPLLSRHHGRDHAKFEEIANKTFKVFLLIVMPILIGTLFLAPSIIRIVAGPDFPESVGVLRLLIFSLAFIFFGTYFNMLLLVGNAQKKLLRALIFVAIGNILINLFLIRLFSYTGAAITSAVTEAVVVGVTAFLTWKVLRYVPKPEKLGSVILAASGMALVLFLMRDISFLISGFASILVYLLLLWVTRAVTPEEITSLISNKGDTVSLE